MTLNANSGQRREESGYVIALTALMLVPLMVLAAFAVDVGGWYAQGASAQRAADAAALAAVTEMPDHGNARQVAMEIVRQNGFDVPEVAAWDWASGPSPQMDVEFPSDNEVQVRLRDDGVMFFAGLTLNDGDVVIERFAKAEYLLPIPMGSPYNILGYGSSFDGEPASGLLLAMEGHCSYPHNGDVFGGRFNESLGCDGEPPNDGTDYDTTKTYGEMVSHFSSNTTTNPNHSRGGHWFVIDVPPGTLDSTEVWFFDAAFCKGVGTTRPLGDFAAGAAGAFNHGQQARLMTTMWDATDTPYTDTDITEYPSTGSPKWRPVQPFPPRVEEAGCQEWAQAYTIPGGANNVGRWYLQVQMDEQYLGGFSKAGNFFAIQARKAGTDAVCDRRTDALCPGIYARDWLPIRAAMDTTPYATTQFYLAEIEPVHQGKTLEVSLYDPGEGMDYLRILDPAGNPLPFEWVTTGATAPFSTSYTANDTCGGQPCLSVSGTGFPLASSDWTTNPPTSYRFQGRTVTIRVKLTGIDWGDYWFRVEYAPEFEADGTPKRTDDIASWAARVIGDPIRLTE